MQLWGSKGYLLHNLTIIRHDTLLFLFFYFFCQTNHFSKWLKSDEKVSNCMWWGSPHTPTQPYQVWKLLNSISFFFSEVWYHPCIFLFQVLVYDRWGQDIISPLLSVRELRELGVTLHLWVFHDFYCPQNSYIHHGRLDHFLTFRPQTVRLWPWTYSRCSCCLLCETYRWECEEDL